MAHFLGHRHEEALAMLDQATARHHRIEAYDAAHLVESLRLAGLPE